MPSPEPIFPPGRVRPGRRPARLAVLVSAFFLMALTAPAFDRIQTRDGRELLGSVVRREEQGTPRERVIIQTGRVQVTLPAQQIASITPATPEDGTLQEARQALANLETAHGLELIDQALEMAIEPAQLANPLANLLLEHGDQLAGATPQFEDAQTTALRRVVACAMLARGLPPDRMSELIARRLQFGILLGNTSDTRRVLDWLGADYYAKNQVERERLVKWVLAALPGLNRPERQQQALAALRLLADVDPELAGSRRTQLVLEWAAQARKAGDYATALHLYEQYMLPDVPEIARDRINLTLEEAEREGRASGDLESPAELYATYGLRHNAPFARERLLALWRDGGWRAIRLNDFATASALFTRMEQQSPGSARHDFALLEYQQRRKAIPTTDTLARFELGKLCASRELHAEAIAEFEKAATNPDLRRAAEAQISQLRNLQAEAELKRMLATYEAGDHSAVLAQSYVFMQQPYSVGYLKQARDLEQLAREAMKLQAAQRPQQAEGLLQQAQRAYYEGRFNDADDLLKTITERYRDTVVYARARNFQSMVRQRLDLARIEHGAPRETPSPAKAFQPPATTPTPEPGSQLVVNNPTVPAPSLDDETTAPAARRELDLLRRNLERMNQRP